MSTSCKELPAYSLDINFCESSIKIKKVILFPLRRSIIGNTYQQLLSRSDSGRQSLAAAIMINKNNFLIGKYFEYVCSISPIITLYLFLAVSNNIVILKKNRIRSKTLNYGTMGHSSLFV